MRKIMTVVAVIALAAIVASPVRGGHAPGWGMR